MAKPQKSVSKVDQLIDELLEDCHCPEDIIGQSGLLNQLSKRLIERSLAGELTHHLKTEAAALDETTNDSEVTATNNSAILRKRFRPNREKWRSRFLAIGAGHLPRF